jgi:hypothetical protein
MRGLTPHSFSVTFLTLGLRPLLFCCKFKKKGGTDSTHTKKKDQRKAHEGFSYLLFVSAFLSPYSFSVTFFSLWPSPFFILLQNKQERKKDFFVFFPKVNKGDRNVSSRVGGSLKRDSNLQIRSCVLPPAARA